jgi:predicted O-methyltransferase YrrM
MAENQFIPSIGPVKGKIITGIIKKYKPKNILEIGALYGYSAVRRAIGGRSITIQR